jgi:hypothetical protein
MHLKTCVALLLIMPAAFASSVDLKTQLQSCQQVSDEEQRLSCFDQLVSQLDSAAQPMAATVPNVSAKASSIAPAPSAAQQTTASPQPDLTEKFGLKTPRPDAEILEITSVVKTVGTDLRKKLLVTLENGQQWRQIDQEYLNIKPGDRCVVKRGAIGSFLLGIEGAKKKIRVRRVE